MAAADDLQIRQQGRVVQGGAHLADAAAGARHQLTADDDGRGAVAGPLAPRAHDVVVREHLAGEQHGAVDRLAGEPDIVPAVAAAASQRGGIRCQWGIDRPQVSEGDGRRCRAEGNGKRNEGRFRGRRWALRVRC